MASRALSLPRSSGIVELGGEAPSAVRRTTLAALSALTFMQILAALGHVIANQDSWAAV